MMQNTSRSQVTDQKEKCMPIEIPLIQDPTCEGCGGLCCRSFVLPIDTPETREDFDLLRWLVLHHSVQLLVQDTVWEIEIGLPCEHIQPNGRCGIYGRRPQVCVGYDIASCERHQPPLYDAIIDNEHALEAWVVARYGMRPTDPRFPHGGATIRVGLFG